MDLSAALSQSTAPGVLVAAALVLGVLHGLEPGHSKTMMAAFIIAVRGTVGQAVLLGLSAALSHTLIVWILALLALRFGDTLIGEHTESWFMLASGGLIVVIGAWMALRTWRHRRSVTPRARAHSHSHHHSHSHSHSHHQSRAHDHRDHEDAHARAHARAIEERFAPNGTSPNGTSLGQTILFGLSGGLIPCSAAITVLVACLQIDRFWTGVGLVGAFSVGLATSLVAVGVAAALGMRAVSARTGRFDRWLARVPYVSAVVVVAIGVLMAYSGWHHLTPPGA